jgi:hypothetical protein
MDFQADERILKQKALEATRNSILDEIFISLCVESSAFEVVRPLR